MVVCVCVCVCVWGGGGGGGGGAGGGGGGGGEHASVFSENNDTISTCLTCSGKCVVR